MPVVKAVILAAGLSKRMGAPKLLIEIAGRSVISRVVGAVLESQVAGAILVVGPRREAVLRALGRLLDDPRLRIADNLSPESGMSSSLRAGLASVGPEAAGVVIVLADQPLITARVIDKLLAEFLGAPDMIVLPTIYGRRSNPVVFPPDLFGELMAVSGDVGGRNVVKRNTHRVVEIEMGEWYADADLDTPEDLEKIQRHMTTVVSS